MTWPGRNGVVASKRSACSPRTFTKYLTNSFEALLVISCGISATPTDREIGLATEVAIHDNRGLLKQAAGSDVEWQTLADSDRWRANKCLQVVRSV